MHDLAGTQVVAISVGGLNTCIELPGWKLCFDIGHCPQTAVRWPRVLFTHAHVDHMGGAHFHAATRNLLGMSAAEYCMPAVNVEAFHSMLDAWRALDKSELPCSVEGVKPGDVVPLGRGRTARVFQALHRVPAVGYALCSTKQKLKAEFLELPGSEIGRLRSEGVEITNTVETVEVAFCGDTLIDVVEREKMVRTAKLLILECTFLDDRVSVESARGMGHVHLDEIIERAELFENEQILLTHFSARYRPSDIREILARRLPESLAGRVTPNLDGHHNQ